MITIVEELIGPDISEFSVDCPHCCLRIINTLNIPPFCHTCHGELPYYIDLIEELKERMLYFEIGDLWEEGQ